MLWSLPVCVRTDGHSYSTLHQITFAEGTVSFNNLMTKPIHKSTNLSYECRKKQN